jgi:hypothetical protein
MEAIGVGRRLRARVSGGVRSKASAWFLKPRDYDPPVEVPESPIAALALLLVIPGAIIAFSRYRPTVAVLLVVFVSTLLLPEAVGFDAPLIPPLDKESLPALCMLIGVILVAGQEVKRAKPGRALDLLLVGALFSVVATGLTNPDIVTYGKVVLPGYAPADIVSDLIREVLASCVPFFVARVLFRTADDARLLLRAMVVGGLVYLPLCLLELRLSPFLHLMLYGFIQQSFDQAVRSGGYRPVVFMAHGLSLALFVFAASVAGWVLYKARYRAVKSLPPLAPPLLLSGLLALLNSLGALIYGFIVTPVAMFLRPKAQLRFAAVLALFTALYPLLCATDNFPHDGVVDLAAKVSQERAESLDYRFTNEEVLLERALKRQWFGWGGFGRTFVWDDYGETTSVPDGEWIITLGVGGIVGFVFHFGTLLVPIWVAYFRLHRIPRADQPLLAGVGLIATGLVVDLLPNGMFNTLPMFVAGALGGLSYGMAQPVKAKVNPRLLAAWLLLLQRARLARAPRYPTVR